MDFDPNKIQAKPAFVIVAFIAGTICTGFLFFYTQYRDLFFTLDIFRLCILSLAITLPSTAIISFSLLYMFEQRNQKAVDNETTGLAISIGSMLTAICFIIPILTDYFYPTDSKSTIEFVIKSFVFLLIGLWVNKIINTFKIGQKKIVIAHEEKQNADDKKPH
jgi:hypothetical protein